MSLPTPTAGKPFTANRLLQIVAAVYAVIWIVAAIAPRDFLTWALENLLVVLFVALVAATYRRFAFSDASYLLLALFLCFHAYGAHYGYANTPLGFWLKSSLGLGRNPYDRIIHCAFGLLLVYPLREMLLRLGGLRPAVTLWLAPSLVLALSTFFEVVEAIVATIVSPESGPQWLGGQGDEWDSQSDMLVATLGALATMAVTWWLERKPAPREKPARRTDDHTKPFRARRLLHVLCALYAVIWTMSAINPISRGDWLLENLLVFAFFPLLVFNYRRLALSNASYLLLFLFLSLHTIGAHYTYAETPLGYWLKDWFGLQRNHFDRIVHFSFGLLLTYPTAEVMVRTLRPRGVWAVLVPVAFVIAASGLFEIIEGIVAWIVSPELGADYLGTQGDVWDAQKDMGLAIIAVLFVVPFAPRNNYRSDT
jgi:putative membrane protein